MSAARFSRRFTVGSSPYWSSPTSASAIARRIAGVGRVNVSLRSSMLFTCLVCGRVTNIVVWSPFRIRPDLVAAQFPDDRIIAVGDERGLGGEAARLAKCVGMRVIGVRRRPAPQAGVTVLGADRLAEVAHEADYLAITAPLTPETRGAISKEIIARLKPTAWVMNIARGAIIDEPALIDALREGRIAGAALDVFATEPLPPDSP